MSDDVRRRYVVGLGANLGERLGSLQSGVVALSEHGKLLDVSHLYETAAVGPPQPDYLNAAVLLESSLAPAALLTVLLEVERRQGRVRRERWGPRTLDLDLLFSPALIVHEPHLKLPHPELGRRAFALAPLVDVMPDARDPSSGAPYAQLLDELDREGVRLVQPRHAWDPRPNS
jgi:2-amino-4-hydroxy-6-hydroxymethyldihydropteridine diphosphokinase